MSRNLPLPAVQGQVDFTVTTVDGTTGAPVPSGSTSDPAYFNPAQNTYQLASSISLASAATTTPLTNVIGAVYIWNVVGTFTTGTVTLQSLASDGVTYQDIATVSANGNTLVVIGNNATVRLLGGVATTTALSSSLT